MQYLIPSLQSLVAVISLSMLDPQRAIECFYDQQDVVQSIENGKTYTTYISDPQTITDLHQFLVDAASGLSSLASPAVLAWSIILKTMRDTVTARKEARELRQSVRAEEALEDDASFDDEAISGTRGGRPRGGRRYSASSEGSVEAGMYDNFLETIKDMTPDDDPILFLGAAAVEGSNVFDVLTSLATFFAPPNSLQALGIKIRLIILALTRCSLGVLDYNPEVVTTTLAVLSGDQQFWDLVDSLPVEASNDPLAIFLEDEYLVQRLLDTAMSRYPYERLPFLKFIRAIAACRTMHDDGTPIAVKILEKIPSFTFQLPSNFREYETIQEEDNANTIQLTQDILLFQPRGFREIVKGRIDAGASSGSSLISTEFSIPIGTPGRIVSDSDSGPKVAIWFQEYSGLKYMGKLLETALTASDYVDATSGEIVDRDSLAEIISLFATLLHTSMEIGRLNDTTAESHSAACRILEEASDGLDRNRDIVTVIFKIFEEELQRQSTNMDTNNSLDVLIASLQFIFALVPILPGRVWPLLGRSELLDIDGRGGKLSSILGRVEIVNCRYDFVLSCTRVLQALVEDATRHAVLRKVGSKSLVRMGSKEDLGTGVPDQILSTVLLSFTRTMVDVFESACNWRFAVEKQRLELSEHISTVLQNILHYTYSVDDMSSKEEKLTKVLNPAAIYIVDFFLSTGSGQIRFRPILRVFLDGFSSPDMTFQTGTEKHWIGQVRAALYLTTTLMKLAVLLDRPTSQLEHQLFKVSPLVARLYAVRESYRLHVVKLLEALVISASSRKGEPPSLLGHLGPQTSEHFIHMLLDLDKPLDDDARVVAIWHLMSIVVSSRQQWFSIYLLTGRPPRDALRKWCAEDQAPPSRTLLKIALTALSDIKRMPMPRSMAMLEFISLSQNFWPWAMSDIHLKQSNFIKSILEFVAGLLPVAVSANEDRSLEGCFESRVAAYIAEILAMYLYHSQQVGNTTASKEILTHIGFYTKCAVAVPAYNSSLHGNLRRNFEAKFPGCSLQHFKRTKLEAREFGREYFYDGQVANKMLSFDQAWTGRKNDGFAEELAKANVNLSLVDAQVVSKSIDTCGQDLI
jgi:nuclear pore complex protein Nup188